MPLIILIYLIKLVLNAILNVKNASNNLITVFNVKMAELVIHLSVIALWGNFKIIQISIVKVLKKNYLKFFVYKI